MSNATSKRSLAKARVGRHHVLLERVLTISGIILGVAGCSTAADPSESTGLASDEVNDCTDSTCTSHDKRCHTNVDCTGGQVCDTASGACAAPPPSCIVDGDCAREQLCDIAAKRCVISQITKCTCDTNCATGATCDLHHGVCTVPAPPLPTCAQAGGNTCGGSRSGACKSCTLLPSSDCGECCFKTPPLPPPPRCAAAGGNTCGAAASGVCAGQTKIVSSNCAECCHKAPPPPAPPPTCGDAGGNTCGAAGSGVCDGFPHLVSSDCPACCHKITPPKKTCGAAGGNTCGAAGSGVCSGLPHLDSSDCAECCDRPAVPVCVPGSVIILNVSSSKLLEIGGGQLQNGAGANQWVSVEAVWQHWRLRPVGASYEIVNLHSGQCLEVGGSRKDDGAGVNQWPCTGGPNQLWSFALVGGSTTTYQITNVNSGRCLEIGGARSENGATANQWQCLGVPNQQWKLPLPPSHSTPTQCGAPMCGQAGGNTCGALGSGRCNGLPHLLSSDCAECCDKPTPPPMCGQAGGNTCGAAGSSVCNGFAHLVSSDCAECCHKPAPPPMCGQAGGNTSGAAGSTVCNGFAQLVSSDCAVCCHTPPPPPPPAPPVARCDVYRHIHAGRQEWAHLFVSPSANLWNGMQDPSNAVLRTAKKAFGRTLPATYTFAGHTYSVCGECQCFSSTNYSPLVIDLEDGAAESAPVHLDLTSFDEGVAFDVLGTRSGVRVAWPTRPGRVGFLVLDRNGNGVIDDGSEMFGDATMDGGHTFDNGFEALASLDTNRDGRISSRDVAFAELRVWHDRNSDGHTDPGELTSLTDDGIGSIGLHYATKIERVDTMGNEVRQRASVQMTNGERRRVLDLWLTPAQER